MSPGAWAALAAVAGQITAGVLLAWRAGAWAGRIAEILDELRRRDEDKETRLRAVERITGTRARHR